MPPLLNYIPYHYHEHQLKKQGFFALKMVSIDDTRNGRLSKTVHYICIEDYL